MDKKDKELNSFRKIMESQDVKSPSENFTEKVMNSIAVHQGKKYSYSPLITIKGWAVLTFLIIGLISYLVVFGNLTSPSWFGYLDIPMNFLTENELSETIVYASLILGLCFLVQIIYLKNYFSKRLGY